MLTYPALNGPAVSRNAVIEAVALASPAESVFEIAEVERLNANPSGAREKVAEAPADAPLLPLNELQTELPGELG